MKNYILFAVAVLLVSCATKQVTTSPETKTVILTQSVSPEIVEGKSLYENNCAQCHKLYDTKSFSPEEWQPILLSMQKKANLNDAQRIKIYNYITAKNN